MKIYYVLARLISPLFLFAIRLMTRVSRPRVRVMVCNLHKEVLLVRSVFGTGEWELPGGGAGYKESYTAAAARELAEEAAVFVSPAQLKKTTQLQLPYPMIIFSYTLQNSGKQAKIRHPFEIKALGWFSIDNLPAETALYVREIIRGRPDNTDGLMP